MAQQIDKYTMPACRIEVDGKDVTARLRPHLCGLALGITRAGQADEVEMSFDATDGTIAMPRLGVSVAVMVGFESIGVQLQGTFDIDEREHGGAPDIITVRGRSAKLASPLNTRKERSFSNTTVGHVVSVIAGENGLTPRVSPSLAAIEVDQIDQTESDIAMLRRLGLMWDAVATVKNGYLVFAPIGKGTTASGKALPTLAITRKKGDRHRFHEAKRDAYTGVRARWHDVDAAKGRSVLAGATGHVKVLRGHFANEDDAKREAASEMARVKRGAATFSIDLAEGAPGALPEMPSTVSGWGDQIGSIEWIVKDVKHRWTGNGGYTTELELENKGSASDHPVQDEGDEEQDDVEAAA
jgi:uncharacterized protein